MVHGTTSNKNSSSVLRTNNTMQCSILIFASLLIRQIFTTSEFCYKSPQCGPKTWTGICQTGNEQSPIDIPVIEEEFQTTYEFNSAYFSGKVDSFFGLKIRHTLQLQFGEKNLTSSFYMGGGGLTSTYVFSQMHFHWGHSPGEGSEHFIHGEKYDLELHLVHYDRKFPSIGEALKSGDRQALHVIGIVFLMDGYDNSALEPIISAMSALRNDSEIKKFEIGLNVMDLIPTNRTFARYLGSLTTPTCDEKVVWTVFLDPVKLSMHQLTRFYKMYKYTAGFNNFRPTQQLNRRKVTKGVAKFAENKKLDDLTS